MAHSRLELYVPADFTAAEPAVTYHHAVHDIDIEGHSLHSVLPQVNGNVTFAAFLPEMFPLTVHPGGPTGRDLHGNFVLQGALSARQWRLVQEMLDKV